MNDTNKGINLEKVQRKINKYSIFHETEMHQTYGMLYDTTLTILTHVSTDPWGAMAKSLHRITCGSVPAFAYKGAVSPKSALRTGWWPKT